MSRYRRDGPSTTETPRGLKEEYGVSVSRGRGRRPLPSPPPVSTVSNRLRPPGTDETRSGPRTSSAPRQEGDEGCRGPTGPRGMTRVGRPTQEGSSLPGVGPRDSRHLPTSGRVPRGPVGTGGTDDTKDGLRGQAPTPPTKRTTKTGSLSSGDDGGAEELHLPARDLGERIGVPDRHDVRATLEPVQ